MGTRLGQGAQPGPVQDCGEGVSMGDMTNLGRLYVLAGSQVGTLKRCRWGCWCVTWRMRATEPQFLGIGDKDPMFSCCCGVGSCHGAPFPSSLALRSPWVMGRTQLAIPELWGVRAPLCPRGRCGRAAGRAISP